MKRATLLFLALPLCVALQAAHGAGLSEAESKAAKNLYVTKCAKCHQFHSPTNYSKGEWDKWMTKMGTKARLKPEQLDLVSRYTEMLRQEGKKQVLDGKGDYKAKGL